MANVGWVHDILYSKPIGTADGWFNLPNPWVTDAPGILTWHFLHGNYAALNSHVYVNGLDISGIHHESAAGTAGSIFCPEGVQVSFSTDASLGHWSYRRFHRDGVS